MQSKPIQEETFDFNDSDYKAAIIKLYRRWKNEFVQLEHQYKDWSQTSQVYAYNKYDTLGKPIEANMKAYNETIVERKRLAIMLKLIEQQTMLLESYWSSKGYDINELRNTIKSKQLQKVRNDDVVKKEEPVVEEKVTESPPMKRKTLVQTKPDATTNNIVKETTHEEPSVANFSDESCDGEDIF